MPPTLLLLIGLMACGQSSLKNGATISGKIVLDSVWEPVVYLSYLPTFNDLYTMSPKMILAESTINASGEFSFASNFLEEEEQLFRIHISKKGAPKASLIIGGIDENYLFFIASKKTKVRIVSENKDKLFHPVLFEGNRNNVSLQKIDTIASYIDSTYVDASILKKEFVTKGIYEQLRHTADTASNTLVSLYALYKSNYEQDIELNKEFYETYLEKWKTENSTYLKAFQKEFPESPKSSNLFYYILLGVGLFFSGYFLKKVTQVQNNKDDLNTLSVQERKIFDLLKQGKSNKEISSEFNIGISTVKSHVSNIYSKLNIKSRKDAMDF